MYNSFCLSLSFIIAQTYVTDFSLTAYAVMHTILRMQMQILNTNT